MEHCMRETTAAKCQNVLSVLAVVIPASCCCICCCYHHRSKLFMHLPHKVDVERGVAKWYAERRLLAVCLPIKRDQEACLL